MPERYPYSMRDGTTTTTLFLRAIGARPVRLNPTVKK
jgi:hypothetical protein